MKIILKLSIGLIFIQVISVNSLHALEIKNKNEYLVDVRGDDGDIYLTRLSLHKKLDSPGVEASLFGETQWNFDISEWEKLTLGMEIGKFFGEHFYVGQSIQLISGQMLDYMAFSVDTHSIDTTFKIGINLPLLKDFSLSLFEEYALNIEKGRDEYNEIGAKIIYKLEDSPSIGIGWWHTDRVHNFDTDYLSLSLTLNF